MKDIEEIMINRERITYLYVKFEEILKLIKSLSERIKVLENGK